MIYNTDYFGFIYKWTNCRNQKYYVGSHHGPIDDRYIGSGVWFARAYDKEPEEFSREILEYITVNDPIVTLDVEQRYLSEIVEVGNKDKCYNISRKAGGGWQLHGKTPIEIEEIYKKISETNKNKTPEQREAALEKARATIAAYPERFRAGVEQRKETRRKWTEERRSLAIQRLRETLAKDPEIRKSQAEKCRQTVAKRSDEENEKIKVKMRGPWSDERRQNHSISIREARDSLDSDALEANRKRRSDGQTKMDPAKKAEAIRKRVEKFKNRSADEKLKSEMIRKEKWLAKKQQTIEKIRALKIERDNIRKGTK